MASKLAQLDSDEKNFLRICRIVVEFFRDMVWDFLSSKIQPSDLPAEVAQNLDKLSHLHRDIKEKLLDYYENSISPTNIDVDFTAVCCLTQNLLLRPELEPPNQDHTAVANDLERLRLFRNTVYGHAKLATIPETKYQQCINDITHISEEFGPRTGKDYVKVLATYLSSEVDLQNPNVREFQDLLSRQIEFEEKIVAEVHKLGEGLTGMEKTVEDITGDLDQLQCSYDEVVERQNEDRKKLDEIQSKVNMQAELDESVQMGRP